MKATEEAGGRKGFEIENHQQGNAEKKLARNGRNKYGENRNIDDALNALSEALPLLPLLFPRHQ